VLAECARIRPGAVITYSELAARAGRPGAARAVGQVMATNRFPLLIPCHRVVGAGLRLHGYGGGLGMKAWLLGAEGWQIAGSGPNLRVLVA
jgi:methylated-DNA-[protein]-cysteine S-methyltransferase